MKKKIISFMRAFTLATVGSLVYAFAFSFFVSENKFVPGGISGLSVIVSSLTGLSVGELFLIFNVPLIIIGLWRLGKKFIAITAYASVLMSVAMDALPRLLPFLPNPLSAEPILSALAGGALLGIGMGLVYHSGGSSGGTDIVVRMLRIKYKHIKTGAFYLIIDTAIITLSAIVFRDFDKALYGCIVLIVSTTVLDLVLYGRDEAKVIFIISDKPEEIASRLLLEVSTGVTYLEGWGGYTGESKKVIMCAMKKHLFTKTRLAVREIDPEAFMIVSSATEIFGKGYKKHSSDEL